MPSGAAMIITVSGTQIMIIMMITISPTCGCTIIIIIIIIIIIVIIIIIEIFQASRAHNLWVHHNYHYNPYYDCYHNCYYNNHWDISRQAGPTTCGCTTRSWLRPCLPGTKIITGGWAMSIINSNIIQCYRVLNNNNRFMSYTRLGELGDVPEVQKNAT